MAKIPCPNTTAAPWGWRGRVALRWTWAGFITLVLAYLGTHFVLEYLLQRR